MNNKRFFIFVLIVLVIIYLVWSNLSIKVSHYTLKDDRKHSKLDGLKVIQISDFHNSDFGKNQQRLVRKIAKEEPDIIVITGDFIDSRRTNVSLALRLIDEIVKIAPVYYANGNHEARIPIEYSQLIRGMSKAGVVILENDKEDLNIKGEKIRIMGISDPRFRFQDDADNAVDQYMKEEIEKIDDDKNTYRILLSHRPEHAQLYFKQQIDLTLCGHAHGGQVRIPFIGGLLAPHQGLFPKYAEGMHQKDRAHLIISRGLGQSIIPLRINNRRELVVITIEK